MKTSRVNGAGTRLVVVATLFGLCFCAVAMRAVHLQILKGDFLSKKAARQYERPRNTAPSRGVIYDARHRELAVSTQVTSVFARPAMMEDKKRAAKEIATCLGVKWPTVLEKLNTDSAFVWLRRHATPKEAKDIREAGMKGVGFTVEASRFYPNRQVAAQVMGFCSVDGKGLEGIEYYFDSALGGSASRWTALTDAMGKIFASDNPAGRLAAGNNLILNLDRTIQYIAERSLAAAVHKYQARSGLAIVMVPSTGAVLAMAHVPFFNPNAYAEHSPEQWRNRAVTDAFEPGSTMKIFLAAGALESGKCLPSSIFFCENGSYRVSGYPIKDTHPYGWLSLGQIVKVSSNIGAVKVGETIGSGRLYRTLESFGFGRRTGIDCPGEVAGTLMPVNNWTRIDAAAIAFGQGIAVSAIQMAAGASAIANDGLLMRPYLIQAITDQTGRLVKSFAPTQVRQAVAPQTARTVKKMMETVVSPGGTGMAATLEGYAACGKTGTAQKAGGEGGYAQGRYVSSFVGFAPASRPEITVLVVVDEPKREHYGGVVAAPVFREIAQQTLQYLNVPHEFTPGSRKNPERVGTEA